VRPLSPVYPVDPSIVLDSQTWLQCARKVRLRLAVFVAGSAPDISVWTFAPDHGSGLLTLKSSFLLLRRCDLARLFPYALPVVMIR
jgi:hypothetical protein